MPGYRIDRIAEDIRREISAIFRELKDPRVAGKILSVVHAEVSSDLSYAKINVSAVEGFEAAKEAVQGLKAAGGYIRRELGSRLRLRKVPELRFVADDSIAYGARISKTLSELELSAPDTDEDEEK